MSDKTSPFLVILSENGDFYVGSVEKKCFCRQLRGKNAHFTVALGEKAACVVARRKNAACVATWCENIARILN